MLEKLYLCVPATMIFLKCFKNNCNCFQICLAHYCSVTYDLFLHSGVLHFTDKVCV